MKSVEISFEVMLRRLSTLQKKRNYCKVWVVGYEGLQGVRVGVAEYREQEGWDGMWGSQGIKVGMGGGLRDTGGCLGVCGVQEGARGYGRV